jgi:hypothetical protein
MKDLFLAECRRFRNAALIFAAVHLLLQLLVNRLTDFPQQRWEVHLLALGAYALAGLGFALYQLGSYRQPARWVWLLHRPLPRAAIFGAIAAASGALILFAAGLPALLAIAGIDWLTEHTIDTRHYAMVAYLVLATAIAWLAGACVILGSSRSAIVVLVLPALVLLRLASVFALLPAALACAVLLAFVSYGSFKPDRTAPPDSAPLLAATAAPLLLGFYFALLWGGSVAWQLALMAGGVHPLNRAVPVTGGYVELLRAGSREAFDLGLAASLDPRAPHWRRQVALLEPGDIEPMGHQFPVRGQLSNRDTLAWSDDQRHIEWTFSHDAMRFQGHDLYTGADRGWFGAGGAGDAQPFPAVPVLPGKGLVMTAQRLYQIDPANQSARLLVKLEGEEALAWPLREVGTRLYTLTNLRLIAHPRAATAASGTLPELYSVALPGPFSDLRRIDIAELLDGTLLSFNYGRQMPDGAPGSTQTLMFVDAGGHAQVVAGRALVHDFPPLFEHRDWWISPLLHAAVTLPALVLDDGHVLDRGQSRDNGALARPRPLPVVAAAALSSLAAALLAWWRLRARPVAPGRRAAWLIACALFGLPSLLCLLVLQPRQRRPLAQAAAVPA